MRPIVFKENQIKYAVCECVKKFKNNMKKNKAANFVPKPVQTSKKHFIKVGSER